MGAIAVLKLFRIPLVFTAVADSAAGYLIARQGRADPLGLGLLAAASGGLYCFGMAMNDIADLERDRTLHPGRVLPTGRLSRRGATAAALAVLAVSAAALAAVPGAPPVRLGIWGAIVFFILVYDFFLKWPVLMGLIRAFNFLLGVSCAGILRRGEGPSGNLALLFAGAVFLYVLMLTFVSLFEEVRDRRAPFVAGVAAGTVLMAAAALAPSFAGAVGGGGAGVRPEALAAGGLLAAWTAFRGLQSLRRTDAVRLLVRDGVAGIIVLDASMLLSCGLLVPGLAVGALLVPAALGVWGFKKLA